MSRLVSWYSSDPLFAWFTFLQIISYVILGVTVAIGYRLSVNQSATNQKLEADLVVARTKLVEAETARLELEKALARRELLTDVDLTPLRGFTDVSTVVQFLPNDQETKRAAGNLYATLQKAGWKMERYSPNPDLWLPEWDGVVIEPYVAETSSRLLTEEEKAIAKRQVEAAEALLSFLREHNWEARIGKRTVSVLPFSALSVRVGFKSLPRTAPAPAKE